MEEVVTCKRMPVVVRHKCKAHWPPQLWLRGKTLLLMSAEPNSLGFPRYPSLALEFEF
jgi:hypothetical protein